MKSTCLLAGALSVPVALIGCAGDPARPDVTTVVGQVVDWTGRMSMLSAETNAGETLAVVRPDTRGRFSLRLPEGRAIGDELAPLRLPEPNALCRSSLRLSDPAVRTFTLAGFATNDGRAVSALRFIPNPGAMMYDVRGVAWVYADRPATLNGRFECTLRLRVGPAEQTLMTYDVRLDVGWNAVRSDVETTFFDDQDLFLTAERVTNAAGPVTLHAAPEGEGQDVLNLPPLNVFLRYP